MLSHNLLNILACPACKAALDASDNGQSLSCRTCRLSFPVREGIPVMLLDEAAPLS